MLLKKALEYCERLIENIDSSCEGVEFIKREKIKPKESGVWSAINNK
jgi:hypothetical protein